MKKLVVLLSAILLTACGTTQYNAEYNRQEKLATQAIDKAPDWMSQLPKSESTVFENGTAIHPDFAMADLMAKTMAYAKICTAAGGTVRQQTKMYGNDLGTSVEMAVRSLCPDVDITGVKTMEMKHVAEGNRIRTYVLVALPTGHNNVLKMSKDSRDRAPKAFKELDEITTGKPSPVTQPQSKSNNKVETVPTTSGEVKLLDVDNEAYKQQRAEALEKPGAVIVQTTVQ